MLRPTKLILVCILAAAASRYCQAQQTEGKLEHWPQWRGPLLTGEAPQGKPPTSWGENSNIVWRTAIPGGGSSSPIVWGDKIFLTSATPTGKKTEAADDSTAAAQPPEPPREGGRFGGPRGPGRPGGEFGPPPGGPGGPGRFGRRGGRGGFGRGRTPTDEYAFQVICIDRKSGEILWERTAHKQIPHEGTHGTNTFASASCVTDGKLVYASFGSYGIYCYDFDGNQVWANDLGDMRTRNSFGEGASPALWGDTLIVPWDHEGPSFVAALDAATGEEKWREQRDELTTWNTPLIVEAGGKVQVIINGTNRTRSYDLATGAVIWECGGQTTNPIPSPIPAGDVVFCTSGYRGEAFYAIALESKGDVTGSEEAIAWNYNNDTPYVPSPLLMNDRVYFMKGYNGILTVLDAKTGEALTRSKRLSKISSVYASIVGANGYVYITSRDGNTLVLKDGLEYEEVGVNELGEPIDATPSIVGDHIYIRSASHLYCIGENE